MSRTPLAIFRSHKWLRRITWLALAVVLLGVILWLAVPPLLRSSVERYGSEFLGRAVKVGEVRFKPWALQLSVHDVSIASADGASRQVEIGRIYIDAAAQSLLRLAPVLDAIEVDTPKLRVAHLAQGQFDFDDVLKRIAERAKPKDEEKTGEPQRFALYNIVLRGGSVEFDDRVVGRKQSLDKLDLSIPFLSNLNADREVKVTPRLAFALNGSPFESVAQATPFADTRQADASFRIDGFDLAPFAVYIPKSVPVQLNAGLLDADLRLAFEQKDTAKVGVSGKLALREVKVSDVGAKELASFDRLDVALADMQPLKGVVHVASLRWDKPRFALRRDKSGQLEIPGMAASGEKPRRARETNAPASGPSKSAAGKAGVQPEWNVQVDQVGLRNGVIDWRDEAVTGEPAHFNLQNLQLDARAIHWPMKQPVQFNGKTEITPLNASGGAVKNPATLGFEGSADLEQAKVAASLRGLPLDWATPYLAGIVAARVGGQLDLDLGLARNGERLIANIGQGSIKDAALTCTASAERCRTLVAAGVPGARRDTLIELGALELQNTLVDLSRRNVSLGKLSLVQPRVYVERAQDGRLMYEDWLVASKTAPDGSGDKKDQAAAESAWTVVLGEVDLKDGAVVVRDAANAQPMLLRVNALQAQVRDFSFPSKKGGVFPVQVSARIAGSGRAEPGSLRYEGHAGLEPLTLNGKVQATALPLQVAQPYLPKDLNVRLVRADGSFNGDVKLLMGDKGPTASVKGNAGLDDVRVRAARTGGAQDRGLASGRDAEDLLNWKALALKGLAVEMAPGKPLALDVAETTLSDFFARVIVQENGRINLQDIQGQPVAAEGDAKGAGDKKTDAAATRGGKQVAQVAPPAQAPDPMAPVIRFGPVNLVRGAMYFTDHFVKPNYSTDLTELNGRLSAFSSVRPAGAESFDMADLQLSGKAEGTAAVDVSGKINPLAKPLALDVKARMRDLELPPLSPYSIKYAGHGIERGKLSMDVAYKIDPSGQLTASNKLILKQLAFGEEVKGAPASLPVRLAVALLADRNGVIDVDLPISGSLNDPEFSLGGVILKVIGNLIMKAVTAPFSLLAGAFSGGDEQGSVPFDAGSAALNKSAQEQLDKVAKALTDRPALKMTVVGWADAESEKAAIKRERLNAMVLAQKRRKVSRDGGDTKDVVAVAPGEYAELLKETYKRADVKKPRNMVGLAKDLPTAEMEALLLENLQLQDNAAQELALQRGVAVRDYLASQNVPIDRLFVGAGKLQGDQAADTKWSPKAELKLATQ
ncbi:DUF748 domain-containing protein [Diaphorobacter aerolatus]|uniref:DUF748 domain-containing protein n=1 Tax=Diaphorobacter aerolatus TaxID=1288495 RepID=A0A7H0GJS6_9BURK|nr:DUF748 domain-containing protein [Diaphorobacter aerolatus]QNP48542.1 DUF748 domain-containing protein [Diaphorobacter aerolatus]